MGDIIDRVIEWRRAGFCTFPIRSVPAPGEVGLDYSATCKCGKRVKVTARGSYARHKPPRRPPAKRRAG